MSVSATDLADGVVLTGSQFSDQLLSKHISGVVDLSELHIEMANNK